MTVARNQQICVGETPYYHVVSRCVRRAFLCGKDSVTGKSFEHRRKWLVDHIKFVTSTFDIDVCSYAIAQAMKQVRFLISRRSAC
jgi:putative transposase